MNDRTPVETLDAIREPPSEGPRSFERNATVPATIGDRYLISSFLGMGGMGSVYRVRDRVLDEVVALKFLRRDLVGAPGILDRFKQEVRMARRVTHRNVARTFDIGEHEGETFLTMEYVDGESLAAIASREGALPPARVIGIGGSICAGLEAAHAAGVIHRDLKPDNVLVERSGRVVLTDFGIARAVGDVGSLSTGGVVGTPAYMAPEQVAGRSDIDGRADIYALGVLLYELSTGARAWPGDSPFVVATARLTSPPPDPCAVEPRVPRPLGEVVLRCMARDPADRFASAAEVGGALREVLARISGGTAATAPAESRRASEPPTVSEKGATTVAVLPFHNGGQTADDFIAEELTEDLVDTLSTARGIKVRPRGMVRRALVPDADAREMGRALEVQVVVEGSVRRVGDTLRIAIRLISVAEGFQLWAKRFECEGRDLLVVNDEAARSVAEALTSHVSAPVRAAAPDAEAVELYMRARHALRRGWGNMGPDLSGAVTSFEQALERSPDDPAVASGLALARARRLNYSDGQPAELQLTNRAIERAIAMAPLAGEPWLARATLHYVTSQWADSVADLRRALERAPGLLKAREMLGDIQIEVGRLEDGVATLAAVVAADSSASSPRWDLARSSALLARWEETDRLLDLPVEDEAERALQAIARARIDVWRGHSRFAQVALDGLGNAPSLVFTMRLARALGELVRTRVFPVDVLAEAVGLATQLRRGTRLPPLLWQAVAEIHGFSADLPQCVDALERAVDHGLFDLSWLDRCPVLEVVRGHAAFGRIRARVQAAVEPVLRALDA